MSHRPGCVLLAVLLAVAWSQAGQAQSLDLLIRGGRVIDPRNGIDGVRDVGIADGRIAEVAARIDPTRAETVVDATGLVVAPGLVDLHTHVFFGTQPNSAYSDGSSAIPPDGFTFRAGVTTIVDLSGAGWRDFIQFKEQVIDRSQTRVVAKSTWAAAQAIHRDDFGHPSVGAEADVAVLAIREGEFGFLDVGGETMHGTRKLEAEVTVRGGRIVWDLNGRAGTPWNAQP